MENSERCRGLCLSFFLVKQTDADANTMRMAPFRAAFSWFMGLKVIWFHARVSCAHETHNRLSLASQNKIL